MPSVNSFAGYIFDYGGVLVGSQSEPDQEHLAALAGIPKERFFEFYWKHRLAYDRGDLMRAEYWQTLAAGAGTSFCERVIDELAEADVQSWMSFVAPMWTWIAELRRAGRRVAMLSNMPRDLGEALRSRTDRLQAFDHVTLSYQVRSAKPDAHPYEHCLEGLGTRPEETVFFDDSLANVEAARRLGLRAVQFTNREEALRQLR
ncbi:MAG TPA: HAD family phosphatase [Bryobacteraceae bacterium]